MLPPQSPPSRTASIPPGPLRSLVQRWRIDPHGSYRTWFLWEERLKNFRSIRRGLQLVVDEIEAGSFGTAYRGSSLETVVHSIAEQRQIFRGADHAWLWKPKLRIPDIYENPDHQRIFGRFLATCLGCSGEDALVLAVHALAAHKIKGLGPAAANLLYFLHPTLVVPFNTAIVKGYNALTGARVPLGCWHSYLAMRDGVLRMNEERRDLLSNDLGAIAGLLFDVGSGRYAPPPRPEDAGALAAWEQDLATIREESAKATRQHEKDLQGDRTHTEVQGWLRDLGRALGFDVWVASNDRGRALGTGRLADGCLDELPTHLAHAPGADAVKLIDVLWLERGQGSVAAAFEVEHTTSIYSGIVRLLDLALGAPDRTVRGLYLVAPDAREAEVRAQVARPAFHRIAELGVRYLPYGELDLHRDAMARFGQGMKAIEAVSKPLDRGP